MGIKDIKKSTKRCFGFAWNALNDSHVADIIPTTKCSARKICKKIDFSKKINIVELGPGNGAISRIMIPQMTLDSKILFIDTCNNFIDYITDEFKHDDRVYIEYGCATNIVDLVKKNNLGPIRYVVSGIPFSKFETPMAEKIINEISKVLQVGGKMVSYQIKSDVYEYLKDFNKENKNNIRFDIEYNKVGPIPNVGPIPLEKLNIMRLYEATKHNGVVHSIMNEANEQKHFS